MNGMTEFPFCLVGASEIEARKYCIDNDFIFRCIERDGNKLSITRDIRIDRINVALNNGFVVRAYIG